MNPFIPILVIGLVVIAHTVIKIHQTNEFYRYVMQDCDLRYEQRRTLIRNHQDPNSIPWCDVHATWRRFDRLWFWDWDFESCMVYKES